MKAFKNLLIAIWVAAVCMIAFYHLTCFVKMSFGLGYSYADGFDGDFFRAISAVFGVVCGYLVWSDDDTED